MEKIFPASLPPRSRFHRSYCCTLMAHCGLASWFRRKISSYFWQGEGKVVILKEAQGILFLTSPALKSNPYQAQPIRVLPEPN